MIKFEKRTVLEYVTYSVIIAVGVLLDQLTKLLAVKMLQPVDVVPIIEGVIHLNYETNTGMAFSLLSDQRWIFMSVSVVMIAALSVYLYGGLCQNRLYAVAMAMVISGGIGNMIDRVALGYVVDFIDFTLIDFAVFNVADSFVCVGAGLLILALVLDIIKEAREKKS